MDYFGERAMKLGLLQLVLILMTIAPGMDPKPCVSSHGMPRPNGPDYHMFVPETSKYLTPYFPNSTLTRAMFNRPLTAEEERKLFENEKQKTSLLIYISIFGGVFMIIFMVTSWLMIQKCKKCVNKLSTPTNVVGSVEHLCSDVPENNELDDQEYRENKQLATAEDLENQVHTDNDDLENKKLVYKKNEGNGKKNGKTNLESKIKTDRTVKENAMKVDSKLDYPMIQENISNQGQDFIEKDVEVMDNRKVNSDKEEIEMEKMPLHKALGLKCAEDNQSQEFPQNEDEKEYEEIELDHDPQEVQRSDYDEGVDLESILVV